MNSMKAITYKPLHSNEHISAEMIDGLCRVRNSRHEELLVRAGITGSTLLLNVIKNDCLLNDDLWLVAVEYILGHTKEIAHVEIINFNPDKQSGYLLQKYFLDSDDVIRFARHQFFQLRGIWHLERDYNPKIETWTHTQAWTSKIERIHPVRTNVQAGTLYSKYVPEIEKTLSFKMIDPGTDLDIFHKWQNQPRINQFWELGGTKPELLDYIQKTLKDPHTFPMLLLCNDIPVGYFEMYWCREDRLAPYYESDAYDRGFHFLIGENNFLGFKNTDATLKVLTHFLFIDDLRTRRLMAEPRSDNTKVLKYIETFVAWKNLFEFDFPHKRSAMLECKREDFFTGNYL